MNRVIVGGFIGAVVAFIWMMVSWMVLPWHNYAFNQFKNQKSVAHVIEKNAPQSGIYIFPYSDCEKTSCEDERKAMMEGPFIYAQVKKEGMDPFNPLLYIISFIEGFIGAAFISYLLKHTNSGSSYCSRVFLAAVFGLVVGVLAAVPDWNWMGASGYFTFIEILDYLITFGLIGFVIAGFVKPQNQ